MSQVIWKYSIPVDGGTHIFSIPGGVTEGAVLVEANESGVVTIWLLIDLTSDAELVRLTVVGTGHEYPDDWYHIGSCRDNEFIWHVVEKIEADD